MMETKWRILALGGACGLASALAMIGGAVWLGEVAGSMVGGIAAISLTAGGSWLAATWLSQEISDRLEQATDIENRHEPFARLGWIELDERLDNVRRSVAGVVAFREEADQIQRLLRKLQSSLRDRVDDIPSTRGPLGQLRAGFLEVSAAAAAICDAAKVLNESSTRLASGANDQKETVNRTTHTVEALSDRIDRISRSADDAAESTERTRQQASRGLEQIQGIIAGMDRLRGQVEANARKARRLGERSVEIGAIVELISGISSRTDMLALNATIESVRAGEHGRGFAVVAEEIRKLAERTATATREIGTLVEAIQADTHESIRSLAEEQGEMEQQVGTVREAGSALERISQMAESSARLVEEISRSANDQVQATRDLVSGMRRISDASRGILGESDQVREASRTLDQRCQLLVNLAAFDPVAQQDSTLTIGNGSRMVKGSRVRGELSCEVAR